MTPETQPNVGSDLVRIHKVITRALEVSIQTTRGSVPEEYREGFAKYIRALTILLHAHHSGEDELAFPFWREKLPDGPFDVLIAQHQQMIFELDQLEHWLEAGAPAGVEELHQVLAELSTLWHAHIDMEEATVGTENSFKYLTPAENAQLAKQLSEHGQGRSRPAELVMPFIVYNLSAEDRAEFIKLLPPIMMQQLIPMAWKAAWAPMKPFLQPE